MTRGQRAAHRRLWLALAPLLLMLAAVAVFTRSGASVGSGQTMPHAEAGR